MVAGLRLLPARTGDHPLIHRLLMSVFHGPSLAEFQAQLDEPGYLPSDRLVVKDGDAIAAHLRLARQTIQFGSQTPARSASEGIAVSTAGQASSGTQRTLARSASEGSTVALPAARFMDLATAPEYRSRGFATTLLAAGEQAARERGLLVAVTRTLAPELFHRQGWSICGRHLFSTAAPRSVLAELGATAAGTIRREPESAAACLLQPRPEPIAVRPLRRIELPAVVRLYQAESTRRSGWPLRSEEYFEWLLARGACDRIYIAASGPETSDIEKLRNSVVGYAFVRQGRIVELIAADASGDVARHLAARVCADASEHGGWEVRCDAPGEHPLHELLCRAGGKLTCDQQLAGEYFMAKLLDPLAVLRQMADLFAVRLNAIDSARNAELGIELRSQAGGRNGMSSSPSGNGAPHGTSTRHESVGPGRGVVERYRLLATNRGVEVATGGPARHTIVLRYSDLAPLVLGDCSADDWIASGRMRASSRTARQLAASLFPRAAWWRPPLDDLLA